MTRPQQAHSATENRHSGRHGPEPHKHSFVALASCLARHNHWEHFTLKFGSKGLVLDLLNLGQGLEDGGGDTGRGTLVKTPAQKSFLPFPHVFPSFFGNTGLTLCRMKKRRDMMWSREKSRSGSEGSTSETSSSGLVSTSEPRLTLLQYR